MTVIKPKSATVIKRHSRPKTDAFSAKTTTLEIKNLHASVNNQPILKGINLTIKSGEIHAIMGPNGSGKSTLVNVLMGHPKYEVTKGTVLFNDTDILELEPTKRAHLGLFLGFQQPLEIPGVNLGTFLRLAKNSNLKSQKQPEISPADFLKTLKENVAALKMDDKFMHRAVNEGFSGGERKRTEIVQMSLLEPKIALLDEIDSGLDIDALRIVAEGIKNYFEKNSPGILLVTHYQRILNYIAPDFVHIIANGQIVKSGDRSLAKELEKKGYTNFLK
ncbi:Fe-S cluster assembly ATPase SufC [Candidatus Peregrinibacteria bacterium]|nr:Fe-S cluster assembly ATPase SufC [Candidatus Peregrinibacteria bacterium]